MQGWPALRKAKPWLLPNRHGGTDFSEREKCFLSPSLVSGICCRASSVASGTSKAASQSVIAPDLQRGAVCGSGAGSC